jgi:hypothetical protein
MVISQLTAEISYLSNILKINCNPGARSSGESKDKTSTKKEGGKPYRRMLSANTLTAQKCIHELNTYLHAKSKCNTPIGKIGYM